jgi:hypothetical protein
LDDCFTEPRLGISWTVEVQEEDSIGFDRRDDVKFDLKPGGVPYGYNQADYEDTAKTDQHKPDI